MEFEVKHKVSGDWVHRILDAGFLPKKESHQIDSYFLNNENRDDGRHYLRIREDVLSKKSSLDYHVVVSDFATKETEVTIGSAEDTKIIMGYLGLKLICKVDKYRQSFSNGAVTLTHDAVKDLGNFIEIEIVGDDETSAKSMIGEIELKLGLDINTRISKRGYPDLLLEIKNGVKNEV